MTFKHLGKRSTEPIGPEGLETFPKPFYVTLVALESLELTSFCPVTEQPDFSTVLIAYAPILHCLETKSLKLYLQSFRDQPIFGEALSSQLAGELFQAIDPEWIEVELKQGIRGGIQLTARSRVEQNDSDS